MKNHLSTLLCATFTALLTLTFSCQEINLDSLSSASDSEITIENAKEIMETKSPHGKKPIWEVAEKIRKNNVTYIHVPLIVDNSLTPAIPDSRGNINYDIKRFNQSEITHLFAYKDKEGVLKIEVLTYIADDSYYAKIASVKKTNGSVKFSGYALVKTWEDKFIAGYKVMDDVIVSELVEQNQNNKARIADNACGSTSWLRCTCNEDPSHHYVCSCTVYGMDNFGCIYYPNPTTGTNNNLVSFTNGGGNNFAVSQNGGINSFNISDSNINFPGNDGSERVANITEELKCFQAGSNTGNYNYSITVHVDEPYPSSGSSITSYGDPGHVFVSFQKQEQTTGATYSSTVGFYPSVQNLATVRNGVPSLIRDNTQHYSDVSITYNLNATQFEDAVYAARGSSTRSYSLENYNCTDFAYSICSAAGVVIPQPYSYLVVNGQVFTLHSPGALGVVLRRINSNAVKTGQMPPGRSLNCN